VRSNNELGTANEQKWERLRQGTNNRFKNENARLRSRTAPNHGELHTKNFVGKDGRIYRPDSTSAHNIITEDKARRLKTYLLPDGSPNMEKIERDIRRVLKRAAQRAAALNARFERAVFTLYSTSAPTPAEMEQINLVRDAYKDLIEAKIKEFGHEVGQRVRASVTHQSDVERAIANVENRARVAIRDATPMSTVTRTPSRLNSLKLGTGRPRILMGAAQTLVGLVGSYLTGLVSTALLPAEVREDSRIEAALTALPVGVNMLVGGITRLMYEVFRPVLEEGVRWGSSAGP